MLNKPIIAVWFSCGAASALAAKLAVDKYSVFYDVRVVNNPVAEEDVDNRRFLDDVSEWIGVPIEIAINSKYPNASCIEVWDDKSFMSGNLGAPCTVILKKHARQEWENLNKPAWHVLGFTADEITRHDRFISSERDNVLPVLIEANLTKQDCLNRLIEVGIKPPRAYALGYPNANCYGCVKASSPTYWNHVRRVHPEVFKARAEQSRRIGTRLVRVKGVRIFLDELDPAATGNSMKLMTVECGTFCEEPTNT